MEKKSLTRLAYIGGVLSFPAAMLVVSGLAQELFGLYQLNNTLEYVMAKFSILQAIIHPVVVIGGLIACAALNVLPVIRITFVPEDGTLIGVVRTKNRLPNLAVLAFAALLLLALIAYAIVENYRFVPTH